MISEPESQPDVTVVGDVMVGRHVADSLRRIGADETAGRVRGLLPGRAAVGNLECALCDIQPASELKPDGSPNLHAPASAAEWLSKAGFRAFALANNHVMDCGPRGLARTIECLHRAGIETVGAGRNLAEAMRPLVLKCGTRQVAFLAFGNGPAAGRKTCGVAPYNSDVLAGALGQVPPSVDATVVIVHAGLGFLEYPESHLRQFADEGLDAGADLVVGCHPHCIRGVERSGRGVILYGLGDFLADMADGQLLAGHLARTALTRLGFEPSGAANCRQALACDVFLTAPSRLECRLRAIIADEDFLPRGASAREHREVFARIRKLSRPLRHAESPEMLRVKEIEQAYLKAYGRGRKLKDWLTLPFRLRPRHAAEMMRGLARVVGGSWERS